MKKENTALRLKQLMNERNLRQVDILELTAPFCKKYSVKMNKSDISQYVSGKVEPSQDKLVILGMALHVNEAWLMGYDVSMDSKLTPNQTWDIDAELFQEELNEFQTKQFVFTQQLKVLGWICEPTDNGLPIDDVKYDTYYLFKKGTTTFRVTWEDYKSFIDDSETFFNNRLQVLFKKSVIELFPLKRETRETPSHLIPAAAHARTDIEVTDEMRQHDMDIMNDPNF